MAETVRIEIPIETIDKTDPGLTNIANNLKKVEKAANSAKRSAQDASTYVSKFDRSAEKTQKTLSSWAKEKYEILLEAKDKVTPVLKTLGGGLKNIGSKAWSVTLKAVDMVTAPVRGILNILKNPVFQVGAVLGVSIGLTDTINTFKDFEAAMSQVKAISGATASDMDKLGAKAKEMGATTKFTATQAAEGFNYMAMAGWETKDMLEGIDGILNLAAASGTDLATTSDIVTDALTAFGLKAADATHFSDVLAAASSSANTNVAMMGETFKYVGTMAGSLKYSIEDVALATGLMANAGLKSSMAGTSLNTIFTRLSTNTSGSADALKDLGINFFDSSGKARDLSDVMEELRKATASYTDEQKTNLANTVAGMEAQKGLLAILNATEEDYKKVKDAVEGADGASKKMSDTMMDNLAGSLILLQSAADGVKNSFGERLSPYLRDFANWLTGKMPDIGAGLDRMMDTVDRKVAQMKERFAEISATPEWQNADFFGKVKIAWDEIIANPFMEWYNSSGKQMLADVAGDIGKGIGFAISSGVLMLLGITAPDTVNEGVSIGKSFAAGFAEGFDFEMVSEKLKEGIKGMLSNAAKLLPGGEEADLSAVISAAILAKVAAPLVSMGGGALKVGKAMTGNMARSMLGSFSVAGEAAGTGLATGSGALGALGNAGMALGSGAASSAGLVAAGGAGVAGGVVGGVALGSGVLDVANAVKANKSGEKEKAVVEGKSAAMKFGSVGVMAATGAAVGSVVPVIGTAIGALAGAGIGGIIGLVGGKKLKEKYREEAERAQMSAEKADMIFSLTGQSVEDVRFKTGALNDALNDAELSAEEFGQMFQEAVGENLQSRFGDVTLSLKEVQELAQMITFGPQADGLNKFATAAQDSESSLSSLQGTIAVLDKANWEISLRTNAQLSDDELEAYKASIDNMVAQANTYLKDKNYEATVALRLLVGDDTAESMTGSLNSMYESLHAQIESLNGQIADKISISMSDGVITLDEEKEIINLQNQIVDITKKVSAAEEDAKFESLKIRYGLADLDYDSFGSLLQEVQADAQGVMDSYDSALELNLTNLKLQLDTGTIDKGTYEEMLQKISDGYNEQIMGLQDRIQTVPLEIIAEKFASELDGILPEMEGTAAEKLKTAMDNALSVEPDPAGWSTEDIVSWFGLDNLNGEDIAGIGQLLKQAAMAIPDSIREAMKDTEGITDKETLEQYKEAGQLYADTMADGVVDGLSANTAAIRNGIKDVVTEAASSPVSVKAQVNLVADYNLQNLPSAAIGAAGSKAVPGIKATRPSASKPSRKVSAYASGGIVEEMQLSWVGEEGPEAIIPLNPNRRSRALELFEKTGNMLGVGAHAVGGIVGRAIAPFPMKMAERLLNIREAIKNAPYAFNEGTEQEYTEATPVDAGTSQIDGGSTIQVAVNMSPEFNIINQGQGQSEDDILQVIRRHMKDMADELGLEIAGRLEEVFQNMPLKEA